MKLTVKVLADGAVKLLELARERMLDLTDGWKTVGADLVRSVHANFDAEGRPEKWPPWSDRYAEWRRKHKAGKVLTLSSHLRNSITSEPDAHGVTVGTNVKYAAIHQFGGPITIKAGTHKVREHERARRTASGRVSRRGGKPIRWTVGAHEATRGGHTFTMPARPYLLIQPEDEAKAARTIEEHIGRVGRSQGWII